MGDKFGSIDLFKRKSARVLYPIAQEESSPVFFFKAIFVTPLLKIPQPVNCALSRIKFSAASFNSVTPSRVTVLNLDAILALIEITRAVAKAIL